MFPIIYQCYGQRTATSSPTRSFVFFGAVFVSGACCYEQTLSFLIVSTVETTVSSAW